MTTESLQALIEALNTVLDRERTALLDGQLEHLEPLLAEKEHLIGRLNASGSVGESGLGQINAKVTRNQELLRSAMDGIRAVSDRMAELRSVRSGLETYDRKGRKSRVGKVGHPSFERRA
jgi:flagellar biosynthesis/type III secretory pathway chaperone